MPPAASCRAPSPTCSTFGCAALDPDNLEIVRVAAVLGDIDIPVLCTTTARSEAEVEAALHQAVAAGVLSRDGAGAVAFRHTLVREVAYNGLLATERRRWHEAIAHVLDGRDGSDPATLARHYNAANRPADTLRTSIAAARASAGTYGSMDAITHYVRAAELWNVVPADALPPEPTVDALLREAMLCALNVGMFDNGAQFGARLLDVVDPAAAPEQWSLDAARLAELRWETGDRTGASELLDRAERYLDGTGDSVARVRVLERKAFHAITSGQNAEGLALAEQALAAARRTGDAEAVAIALNRIAIATASLGERNGRELLYQAFEEAWRSRLPLETARAGINMLLLLHAGCRLQETVEAGNAPSAPLMSSASGPHNEPRWSRCTARAHQHRRMRPRRRSPRGASSSQRAPSPHLRRARDRRARHYPRRHRTRPPRARRGPLRAHLHPGIVARLHRGGAGPHRRRAAHRSSSRRPILAGG